MAESKSVMLAKSVQKHAGRAKEKVSFHKQINWIKLKAINCNNNNNKKYPVT